MSRMHPAKPPGQLIYGGRTPDPIGSAPCTYYHVTARDNVASIREHGLRPDAEGHVFLLTDWRVSASVATSQLFLGTFALFGITGRLRTGADRVAEATAGFQRIYRKPIDPSRLVYLGEFRVVPRGLPTELLDVTPGAKPKAITDPDVINGLMYGLPTLELV